MSASSHRPLKVGIMLPESEREMAGATAGWSDFLAMAGRTEDLGFDSLWFADHLLMKMDGQEPQGAWECWSMLSALAAATSRLEIGPLVSCTAYRNPALTAKMAETLDELALNPSNSIAVIAAIFPKPIMPMPIRSAILRFSILSVRSPVYWFASYTRNCSTFRAMPGPGSMYLSR